MPLISRGFHGRRRTDVDAARVPPGQYVDKDFPVLSAGPTPSVPFDRWLFTVDGAVGQSRSWTWNEFTALPSETVTVDIHCVTKWSRLGTEWTGVSVDVLLDGIETAAQYLTAHSYGGYTTNLPLADVMDGQAWVACRFDGEPLEPEHGGPARLLVPHLYFWKSAKWVRGLTLMDEDEPGFWERYGYHNYGDPWKELAAISRGRFVGYSPSEKAGPHSAAGVDAGTTVPGHPVPGPGRVPAGSPGGGPSRLSTPQTARARHRHRVGSDARVGPASDPVPRPIDPRHGAGYSHQEESGRCEAWTGMPPVRPVTDQAPLDLTERGHRRCTRTG